MAQQLTQLRKSVTDMSTEELKDHIKKIRSKKYIEKPATKKRKATAAKKERKTSVNKISALLDQMSIEDREEFLKSIGE